MPESCTDPYVILAYGVATSLVLLAFGGLIWLLSLARERLD